MDKNVLKNLIKILTKFERWRIIDFLRIARDKNNKRGKDDKIMSVEFLIIYKCISGK